MHYRSAAGAWLDGAKRQLVLTLLGICTSDGGRFVSIDLVFWVVWPSSRPASGAFATRKLHLIVSRGVPRCLQVLGCKLRSESEIHGSMSNERLRQHRAPSLSAEHSRLNPDADVKRAKARAGSFP